MLAQFIRRSANKIPVRYLRILGNWWSPFRGAGIKIMYVSPDSREIRVQMRLRWFNRNYVGTHFGGSLYAMTDPFYMMILINNLGKEYIVWDKAACIEFKKPGKGTVKVRFALSGEEIQAIKAKADEFGKFEFDKYVEILDMQGEVVASVSKTLYVRRRHFKPAAS